MKVFNFVVFLIGLATLVASSVFGGIYLFERYDVVLRSDGNDVTRSTVVERSLVAPTTSALDETASSLSRPSGSGDPCPRERVNGLLEPEGGLQENGTYALYGTDVEWEAVCVIVHALRVNRRKEPQKNHVVYFFNQLDPDLGEILQDPDRVVMRTLATSYPVTKKVTVPMCLEKLMSHRGEVRQYLGYCYVLTTHILGFGELLQKNQQERWIPNSFQPIFSAAELYFIAEKGKRVLYSAHGIASYS